MAKRYILGQTAARWLHDAMNEGENGRSSRESVISELLESPDPFTVRYSSTVANGATTGGWVIWIPTGAFHSASVDTSQMRALTPSVDRWPTGWYLLPSSVQSTLSANGSHALYASSSLGKIVFSTTATSGIKIAEITTSTANATNTVKRVARSVVFEANPRPFDMAIVDGSKVLLNQYYNVGERTYQANVTISPSHVASLPCVLALKVDLSGSSPSATLQSYASISALQTEQSDTRFAVTPLYALDATGSVSCDLRNLPRIVSGEFSS